MKKLEVFTFVIAIVGIICAIVGYCMDVQWATDTAWMILGAGATTFAIQAWPRRKGN